MITLAAAGCYATLATTITLLMAIIMATYAIMSYTAI